MDWAVIDREFEGLEREIERDIDPEVVSSGKVSYDRWVDLRYVGQEYFLNLALPVGLDLPVYGSRELKRQFDELYLRRYGQNNSGRSGDCQHPCRARYLTL